jgi:electron transfer flavoprotein beta subunit
MTKKALVLVKPTPDTEAQLSPGADGSSVDTAGLTYVINPYDEFAIEEALLLKEKGVFEEVVVVSICDPARKDVIVKALAMGADRGLIVDSTNTQFCSLGVAEVLAKIVEKEAPQVVFGGKQAIDDDNMHVLTMLGELAGWPSINVVSKIEPGDGSWKVHREVENGQKEIYEVALPCVIGANKSLNTPRYTNLRGIMQAKKKPIDITPASEFGVEASTGVKMTKVERPQEKPPGKLFKEESVEEMVAKVVDLLRSEAKVI